MSKKLSLVVSVYNEEKALQRFYDEAVKVAEALLSWSYEIIFVNDGSTDGSLSILEKLAGENVNVRVVDFSRNFGHEAAMIAGIDYATGDAIVCMDADLQHPPKAIPEIIEKMESGYDVVSMIRTKNDGAGIIKKITSKAFYGVLNMMSKSKFEPDSSDFFAISKKVADVLRNDYREKVRYLRGFVQNVGFNKTTLEFEAGKRVAGESKYSISKLIKFSVNAICSFSDLPLKLGIYTGSFVGVAGLILMLYSIINKFINDAPSGYTTIVVALCFLFAVLLFVVGIIGQYISILFFEIKDRPIYIVNKVINEKEKK
jgi:dolichol-phosphate mannosyltransferase